MDSPEIVNVIVQGGAVALLLVAMYGGYRIANKIIDRTAAMMENHLTHLTDAVNEGAKVISAVAADIKRIADRD